LREEGFLAERRGRGGQRSRGGKEISSKGEGTFSGQTAPLKKKKGFYAAMKENRRKLHVIKKRRRKPNKKHLEHTKGEVLVGGKKECTRFLLQGTTDPEEKKEKDLGEAAGNSCRRNRKVIREKKKRGFPNGGS